MSEFTKKIVAVLNKNLDVGIAMNALGHMSIGLGGSVKNKEELELANYKDADGNDHKNISKMPFIVLKANSNKIRQLRKQAIQNEIEYVDFNNAMTDETYKEQIERSSKTKEEDLVYYGIILFGDWKKVTEMTKKFSLWK